MKSTQDLIEEELLRLCSQGGFEASMLFNGEGIPMATVGQSTHYNKDALAALSALIWQSAEVIEDFHEDTVVNETSIQTTNKYRIVSRPIRLDDANFILVAIVPHKRAYRKITNKAVQTIQNLMRN
jgi:predicted regulator of Ras-like GTPase activity (Roadblock/LC7/MglB family)